MAETAEGDSPSGEHRERAGKGGGAASEKTGSKISRAYESSQMGLLEGARVSQERKQTEDVFTYTNPRNTNPSRSKVIPKGRSETKEKMTESAAPCLSRPPGCPRAVHGPAPAALTPVSDFVTGKSHRHSAETAHRV